jgi:hypothetical protein
MGILLKVLSYMLEDGNRKSQRGYHSYQTFISL